MTYELKVGEKACQEEPHLHLVRRVGLMGNPLVYSLINGAKVTGVQKSLKHKLLWDMQADLEDSPRAGTN